MSDSGEREDDEWENLVERHMRGELDETEKERLAELLDSDHLLRRDFVRQASWDTELTEAIRVGNDRQTEVDVLLADKELKDHSHSANLLRGLLAVAATAILILSVLLFNERKELNVIANVEAIPAPTISVARITGLGGSLIWTGDRGEIVRDIAGGTELAGGTIEGMSPDSWFQLEFNDGSGVMISGTSTLTFSNDGQKILRLREGRLSADVVPQPTGKPMLVHTPTALLSVLGTQFEVEAGLVSTSLNVSRGKVRLRRLSDGSEVDVPARHVVVADDEKSLTPQQVPESVNRWVSQLNLNREYYGKWSPATGNDPASLKAIPLVTSQTPKITIRLAGLPVSRSDNSSVVLASGSKFIVRGILDIDTPVFFGIRVSYSNGEFAGMFRGDLAERQPLAERDRSGVFEQVYELDNFTLDPAVYEKREQLAAAPNQLVLDGVWAFTYPGSPSGLVLTEVELVPGIQ